jgi:hypothetical protein
MSSVARSQPIRTGSKGASKVGYGSSSFFTVRLLYAIAELAEKHSWLVFVSICLGYGWGRVANLNSRHLDHDEIFTFYIAQAPTLRELLRLTHTIDFHPPLPYLLVRASFAIFGVSAWACRLPFLLAFLGTSVLLFVFLRRLLSPVYGLMGTLFLWSTPYAHLANEARPYAMLLCFTMLMLVSWYQLTEERELKDKRWALATLTASGVGLLLSHVLGVLAYAAFIATEVGRFWIRRRPDWRLWAALLLALISAVAYLPIIRSRFDISFADAWRVTPLRLAGCYWEALRYLITPLTFLGLIAAAWPFVSRRREEKARHELPVAGLPLRLLLMFLFLVPLEIGLIFARTGTAFYERYGSVFLIPCVVFPTLLLGYRTSCNRLAATCVAVSLVILFILNTSEKAWLTEELSSIFPSRVAARLMYALAFPPFGPPPVTIPAVPRYLEADLSSAPRVAHLAAFEPGLALVAGNGPTFMELDQYQDAALGRRLYLLTNHDAAANITHATVFDHYEQVKAAFPIRGQVEPYCVFLRGHFQFLVLGRYNHPDTWLLRKLEMDGATLRIVGIYEGDDVIEEHHIYRVSVSSNPCYKQP